eukprot:ANDGO_00924.mRNA.1 Ammonium transporter 2
MLRLGVDSVFLLLGAFSVFFLQAGFTLIEAGVSRVQNLRSILLQNLAEAGFTCFTWYLVGYALAFGTRTIGGYVGYGSGMCALQDLTDFSHFAFMVMFAMITVTIPSGAVAERVYLSGYCFWILYYSTVVLPPVYHMMWDKIGFHRKLGSLDFAGGLPVHTLGGTSALVATFMIGHRIGRYGVDGRPNIIDGHSVADTSVGSMILWYGWFAYNCCASIVIVGPGLAQGVAFLALNTFVASSAAVMFSLFFTKHYYGAFDIHFTLNSALSGLVIITPTCAFVETWVAVILGVLSVYVYSLTDTIVVRLMIDDPVCASQVHFANGVVGTLLNGIFAKPELIATFLGGDDPATGGLLYTRSLHQLGVQTLAVLSVTSWAAIGTVIGIYVLHNYLGLLRLNERDEIAGLDNRELGGVQDADELEDMDQQALEDMEESDDASFSTNSSQNLDNFEELEDLEKGSDAGSVDRASIAKTTATRRTSKSRIHRKPYKQKHAYDDDHGGHDDDHDNRHNISDLHSPRSRASRKSKISSSARYSASSRLHKKLKSKQRMKDLHE